MRCLCAIALLALAAPAQQTGRPFVFRGGVVNSASFTPNLLPGGGIARGSIFSVFGRNLGPANLVQVSSFPLGDELAGVAINLRQGTERFSAIPLIVTEGQINAILPSNAPLGTISLQVVYNGREGNWVSVRVVEHAPSMFTATGTGFGWGTFFNYESATSQPLNTARASARPGQIETIWLTGTGAISAPDSEAPPVGNLPYDIEIFVGGKAVSNKLYFGRAPEISGVDQVVFTIPDDVPTGCFVPVFVRVNGAVSASSTLAIMPEGGECADAHNPLGPALVRGGKMVHAVLSRGSVSAEAAGMSIDLSADRASVRAIEEPGGPLAFDPFLAKPPPGTCTAYSMKGSVVHSGFELSSTGRPLGLGVLSVLSGTEERRTEELKPGIYRTIDTTPLMFLQREGASLRATGGSDGRAFDISVAGGITLSGLVTPSTITRASGARITWNGQPGVSALTIGVGFDEPTNTSSVFECVSMPGASAQLIPDYVLANLPPTRDAPGASTAQLFFGAVPQLRETTTADGLRVFTARQDVVVRTVQWVR